MQKSSIMYSIEKSSVDFSKTPNLYMVIHDEMEELIPELFKDMQSRIDKCYVQLKCHEGNSIDVFIVLEIENSQNNQNSNNLETACGQSVANALDENGKIIKKMLEDKYHFKIIRHSVCMHYVPKWLCAT